MVRPASQGLKRIFLIGMPGSGKSTIGKLLAEKLELLFIDLDEAIERQAQKSIRHIFSDDGEKAFRQIEAETLDRLLASNEPFVMATGGGTPCYHKGIAKMLNNGHVIFLSAGVETLSERLGNTNNRPLLLQNSGENLQQTLNNLIKTRLEIYQKAHFEVKTDGLSPEFVVIATLKSCA